MDVVFRFRRRKTKEALRTQSRQIRIGGNAVGIIDIEQDGAHITAFAEAKDVDILALLSRQPCTVCGVCSGFGLNPGETTKRLHALCRQGSLKTVRRDNAAFYETVREK